MQNINGVGSSQELILSLEKELTRLRIETWLNHQVFEWQWWLLVAALIIPWLIWWKYADRKHLLEITIFGIIIIILVSYLDALLTELGMWHYNYSVVPLWPRLISADFALLPVTYMFIYQQFKSLTSFLLAMTVTSALLAFAGESFLIWTNIYELDSWKHYYSFPIYLIIGIVVRWLVMTLVRQHESSKTGNG